MTGLKLFLLVLLALSVSYKTTAEQQPAVSIGGISELKGDASVLRDQPYGAELSFSIEQMDDVRTTNGRVGITFLDDSIVRLTEHSKLVITEYVYDPDPSKGKMALRFANGTARFVSSKLGKIDKKNISLSTPTADIAIRGTDFTCTVDELGRSLIILLPDANGISSGEILVTTAMGTVTLNKPYEATTVNVFESTPSKPVILDLTLEIIDNMLIVNPPKEDPLYAEEQGISNSGAILDIDYLEFEDLEFDYLAEDQLEFNELDINYLDVNFFEDLLAVIQELDTLGDQALATGSLVQGTNFGQDLTTQITTFTQDDTLILERAVTQSTKLSLNISQGYTIILLQDGKTQQVLVNGGGDSTIKITQGSG
jgi:hypothetical protein